MGWLDFLGGASLDEFGGTDLSSTTGDRAPSQTYDSAMEVLDPAQQDQQQQQQTKSRDQEAEKERMARQLKAGQDAEEIVRRQMANALRPSGR